jgi:adenylate cyclase
MASIRDARARRPDRGGGHVAGTETLGERRRDRLRTLLRKVERDGARLQVWAATLAIATIALVVAAIFPWNDRLLYTEAALAVFLLISVVHYRLSLRSLNPGRLGFITGTLQIALLTVFLVAPNPFVEAEPPPAMALRESGFRFLLILVCLGALTLSVRLALWLGFAAALAWGAAVLWAAMQPGSIIALGGFRNLGLEERLALYFDPNFVDLIDQGVNVVAMLIIGGILAATVARSTRLAERYTIAERARFNLARHFSPNMVDELATADYPFGQVRRQDVAVIFADMVGFTHYTQVHDAEIVFDLLRQFHRRMEKVVFAHSGTVDNYMGDCIMATFGVPNAADDDAARAIECARAMRQELADWNAERKAAGESPVDVRVGCQHGPVVLGAIGSERNLSFAVVGDTCNVASRLEAMCRELDAGICLGAEVVEAARRAGRGDLAAGLKDHGEIMVRGRAAPVHVWIAPRQ